MFSLMVPPNSRVSDGAPEQQSLLRDNADLLAQAGLSDFTQIMSINADGTFGWIIKAGNQVEDRTLARAAGADQGHNLAGCNIEREIVKHFLALVIAEVNAFKGDTTFGTGQHLCIWHIGNIRFGIEDLEDALGRADGFLHRAVQSNE